jgi:acyl dehydratase
MVNPRRISLEEERIVEEIRFDDIERLRTKISDTFGGWSEPVEVTQDMINRFAELTGDHQWIHVDVERAKRESPFGGTIAHGFLTLSLLPRMHGRATWKIAGYGNATNYGANKLRFVAPVPAGSRIRAHSRLIGVEAKAKGTQVTQEIQVHVVGSDTPAVVYEMVVLYHPQLGRR